LLSADAAQEFTMLIAHDALIMTLDGARMALFRNTGNERDPKLELLTEECRKAPSTAELGDDRPGRTFQSVGAARGAYETTDWHQQQEDAFAVDMAELFNFHMTNDARKGVLIAPPKVLGTVRKHLHPETRERLIAEIDKDYAGRTALEIVELLNALGN
jgi:protein required for attachment to host cells